MVFPSRKKNSLNESWLSSLLSMASRERNQEKKKHWIDQFLKWQRKT